MKILMVLAMLAVAIGCGGSPIAAPPDELKESPKADPGEKPVVPTPPRETPVPKPEATPTPAPTAQPTPTATAVPNPTPSATAEPDKKPTCACCLGMHQKPGAACAVCKEPTQFAEHKLCDPCALKVKKCAHCARPMIK